MKTKRWWARVGEGYGRWMPTGCADKHEDEDYISLYFVYPPHVKEWLLL